VKKRTRATVTALLLLIWQVSAGTLLGVSGAHAHGAHGAQASSAPTSAMVPAQPEADAPCHGHDAETPAAIQEPADDSPCCQSNGCSGACLAGPALPATVRIATVVLRIADQDPPPRLAPVPVFLAVFFRPPI